jgi:hypothetical protein
MNRYITYQCTVCRRTKDVERDDKRAIPSGCTITKGCVGTLFKIGDKAYAEQTKSVAGVTDWYPRGTSPTKDAQQVTSDYVEMQVSSSGALVIAVKMTAAQANAIPEFTLKIQQRRVETIPFTQFIFRIFKIETVTQPGQEDEVTTVVSGRDSQGRNLRIDSTAQSEGRLKVRVNGVERTDYIVTATGQASSISIPGELKLESVIDIIILSEKEVEEKELTFVTNRTIAVNDLSGAWGNVRWVDRLNPLLSEPNEERFWLYTCTSTAALPSSARIKIVGLYNGDVLFDPEWAVFLLASTPYSHVDRYLGLVIPLPVLQEDFKILTSNKSTRDFTTDKTNIVSVYPPLRIKRGYTSQSQSLTSADVIPENSGAIPTDSSTVLLTSTFINGPI